MLALERKMSKVYPDWDEIKNDIDKNDLLAIIEIGIDIGLTYAIQDYIKNNYEPIIIKKEEERNES